MENPFINEMLKAKIYPKIVYNYLRELLLQDGEMPLEKLQEVLWVCAHVVQVLKKLLCREYGIPEYMQYMMEYEALLDLTEGKITGKEFVSREEEALWYILDTKELYDVVEVYLTETEIACIRLKIRYLDNAEKIRLICFLFRFFEKFYEKQ